MPLRNQHALNLLALAVSAGAAWIEPLYAFLFAYVVLGPLHYLTEIAWLDRKHYYHGSAADGRKYLLAAMGLTLLVFLSLFFKAPVAGLLVGICFGLALGPVLRNPIAVGVCVAGIVLSMFISPGSLLLFTIFVPTLVHVYLFTAVFMLVGAIRSREWLGFANLALLLVLPAALLLGGGSYSTRVAHWDFSLGGFTILDLYLQHLLRVNLHPTTIAISDPGAAAIMRLLAFSYLFHYLNWFAKTELLEWHRMSARSWQIIWALYAGSLILYAINFTLGFYALFCLSLAHVFLEFPLNWKSLQFLVWRPRVTGTANLPIRQPS